MNFVYSLRFALLITIVALVTSPIVGMASDEPAEADTGSTVNELESTGSDTLISDQAQATLIHDVVLTSLISGKVSEILVDEGDEVQSGAKVIELDNELASAEFVAAERALEAASVEASNDVNARYATRSLEVSQAEYEKSQAANHVYQGTISETELNRLKLVVDQSRLGIEKAIYDQDIAKAHAGEKQAALQAAQVRLNQHDIVVPRTGQVAEVMVQRGAYVQAGEPIARLIDTSELRIECLVYASAADKLAPGQTIRFEFDHDQSCSGAIQYVSPEIDPVTGHVRVLARVQNPARTLRPGTHGTLRPLE